MLAATTCFLCTDNKWMQIDDMYKMSVRPSIYCFANNKLKQFFGEYSIEKTKKLFVMFKIDTSFSLSFIASKHQRIATERGFVKIRALVPDDGVYLLIGDSLRAVGVKRLSVQQKQYAYELKLPGYMSIPMKDSSSRWANVFHGGFISEDTKNARSATFDVRTRGTGFIGKCIGLAE